MDNLLKTKTIGHPIVMFGENSLNITERIFCLSFFFLGILRKKYFSKIQPQKFSLNYWLRKDRFKIFKKSKIVNKTKLTIQIRKELTGDTRVVN